MTSPRWGCSARRSSVDHRQADAVGPRLTRMKSPTSRVGIIEPEGSWGSTTKERRPNTIRITGKKLAPLHPPRVGVPSGRSLRAWKRSTDYSTPEAISNRNRIRGKVHAVSRAGPSGSASITCLRRCAARRGRLPAGCRRCRPDFMRFCLPSAFEQLFARDVAAVALGEHVLAQGLDGLARDDVGADRRLHRHVEHLRGIRIAQLRPARGAILALARTMTTARPPSRR